MTTTITKPTVLYDGGCPLCIREITFYRRLAGAEGLDWIDVSEHAGEGSVCGVSAREALARFHVVMPGGEARIGAAGFVEIWRHLPAFRPLAWAFGNQVGLWLLERAYSAFLKIRPWMQRMVAWRLTTSPPSPKTSDRASP